MIQLFIFDLGKVLLDFDFDIAIRRLQKVQSPDRNKIYDLFCNSPLAKNWDKGIISANEFFGMIQKELNLKIKMDDFKIIWNEIFSEKTEMIQLARHLHRQKKVALLSNTNPWHAEYVKKYYPWILEFDRFVASCDVQLLKPDTEIYSLVLRQLQAEPSETIYIDDIPSNVAGAKKLGIDGLVFKGIHPLIQDLKLRGFDLGHLESLLSSPAA